LVALGATVKDSMPWLQSVPLKLLVGIGRIKKWLTQRDLRVPLLKISGAMRMASDPEVDRRLQADPRLIEAFMSFPFPGGAEAFFVDTLKRVSRISAPTLVLWGAEDKVDPPETAQLLYEALACQKQLHIIPGNGHVGHLDRNKDAVFTLTADWALRTLL
jgi:pimeloyl-ACP methyl ester carboxylesterase